MQRIVKTFRKKIWCSGNKLASQICRRGVFWRHAASQRGKSPRVRFVPNRPGGAGIHGTKAAVATLQVIAYACCAVDQATTKAPRSHIPAIHIVPPRHQRFQISTRKINSSIPSKSASLSHQFVCEPQLTLSIDQSHKWFL